MLSLTAARRFLQVRDGVVNADQDTELTEAIAAAEDWVAGKVGPLSPTSVTARVSGGTDTLILPEVPALSLTSVTPVGGTALDVTQLHVGKRTGLVKNQTVTGAVFIATEYDVVYQAGWLPLPSDLVQAVKEALLYFWVPQRGNARNTKPATLDRAKELVADYEPAGFA
ncbi:hypothetical protein ACFP8W_06940 [Nocardioides hankookensis]|uniref:Phage gp6-like head-tail connector protein n=1 Tax=Nocardioides hankookensis TaxID=443157 RepID=A0ABW1LP63_9ACTN